MLKKWLLKRKNERNAVVFQFHYLTCTLLGRFFVKYKFSRNFGIKCIATGAREIRRDYPPSPPLYRRINTLTTLDYPAEVRYISRSNCLRFLKVSLIPQYIASVDHGGVKKKMGVLQKGILRSSQDDKCNGKGYAYVHYVFFIRLSFFKGLIVRFQTPSLIVHPFFLYIPISFAE